MLHFILGKWTATWIEDDYLARTPNSIADDVPTIWVGCITRECLNARAAEDRNQQTTKSVASAESVTPACGLESPRQLPSPAWHSLGIAPLLPKLTGGVPCGDGVISRGISVQLPVSTNPPPSRLTDGLRTRSYSVPEQEDGNTVTFEPADIEEVRRYSLTW